MATATATTAVDDEKPFPSALFSEELPAPTHLIELAMRDLSYAIRSKPSWWTKCQDADIRSKWEEEAKAQPIRGFLLEDAHVQYVLDELADYAKAKTEDGIQPGLQRGFWESDELIEENLKKDLSQELEKLRNVPEEEKDWHPGSDHQVLDLIHPSMYCMRYGKTIDVNGQTNAAPPIREFPGFTRLEDVGDSWGEPNPAQRSGYSTSTCWLPTDIQVANDGTGVKLLGYINNVHPVDQKPLQDALLTTLSRFIPIFEKLLGDLRNHDTKRVLGDEQSELDKSNIPIKPSTGEPIESWDEDEEDMDGPTAWEQWLETAPYIDPKPGKYETQERVLGTGYTLKGKKIQIIAKVAEIHLTPEDPTYDGGSWHIEGMLNESIVATGIHYLSNTNITSSKLSFRMALDPDAAMEVPYEQEDPEQLLSRSYGLTRDSPLNQYLGAFEAREGRSIAFPNLYQHKVEPFSLLDPAQPGRRTIIAFFLCDPTHKVLSTSDVAPQQSEWLRQELHTPCSTSRLHNLASELKDQIVGCLIEDEVVLNREQAEAVRETLMEERSKFQVRQNEDVFEAEFSLCEH